MDDLQAISLTDQIVAAYIDPEMSNFGLLQDEAASKMTDEQWAKLRNELDKADEQIWGER